MIKALFKIFIFTLLICTNCYGQSEKITEIYNHIKAGNFNNASKVFRNQQCEDGETCFKLQDKSGKTIKIETSEVRLDIALFKSIKLSCDQSISTKSMIIFEKDCYTGITLARKRGKVARIELISGVDLNDFFKSYDTKYEEIKLADDKSQIEMDNKVKAEQAEIASIKQNESKLANLRNSPEGKKCQAMSNVISSSKMYQLWDKNLTDIKKDAKDAGVYTVKMQEEIDKSLSLRRSFLAQRDEAESEIRKMKNINVDEAKCKKILPDFGVSLADQYISK